MKRIVLSTVIVCLAMSWGFADVLVVDFTGPSSMITSIYMSANQSNTGADAVHKIGGPSQAGGTAYPLYYFDTSALAGATINSASFYTDESWWNTNIDNVEVRRLDCPVMWQPGSGTWNDRWGGDDNGVGKYYVDWDNIARSGHDWAGTLHNWLDTSVPSIAAAIGSEIIDNQVLMSGAGGTWNVKQLVQNWADGTWSNCGFVLYPGDSIATGPVDELSSPLLTIDYTPGAPIPEPASAALVASGLASLVLLKRRRRKK